MCLCYHLMSQAIILCISAVNRCFSINLNHPEAACASDPGCPVQFVLQEKFLILGSVLCTVEAGCYVLEL